MNKNDLRIFAKGRRNLISDKGNKSDLITSKVLNFIKEKGLNKISIYKTYIDEVDTSELIQKLKELSYEVYHPTIINKKSFQMLMLEDEYTNSLKVLSEVNLSNEELQLAMKKQNNIELHICPLLAFDKNLYRLGYGGGYYDRYFSVFSTNSLKVGLAFSEQEVTMLPITETDIKLDMIFTDQTVFHS